MRDFRSVATSVFVALAAWTATVNPLQDSLCILAQP